jgi:hypothetical protein
MKGLSVTELSGIIGVSSPYISNIERAIVLPSLKYLRASSVALSIPFEQLVKARTLVRLLRFGLLSEKEVAEFESFFDPTRKWNVHKRDI